MPVTARLSRRFYDTFGDENTNELVGLLNAMDATYLGELRALNETNYTRFDAKLEQRVAELRAEFNSGLAALRVEVKTGHAELVKWMAGLLVTAILGVVGVLTAILALR